MHDGKLSGFDAVMRCEPVIGSRLETLRSMRMVLHVCPRQAAELARLKVSMLGTIDSLTARCLTAVECVRKQPWSASNLMRVVSPSPPYHVLQSHTLMMLPKTFNAC